MDRGAWQATVHGITKSWTGLRDFHNNTTDGASGKESTCQCGQFRDGGLIPGLGRSLGERNGNSLQYSCLENPRGQRNLVGYTP